MLKNFGILPELSEILIVIEINAHPKFKPKKSIKPHRSNPLKPNTLSVFFHWRFLSEKIIFIQHSPHLFFLQTPDYHLAD